jgi:hypothetical protein
VRALAGYDSWSLLVNDKRTRITVNDQQLHGTKISENANDSDSLRSLSLRQVKGLSATDTK